ncbi:hypothetical protein H2248_011136 [Termitomyces sp. 'cryptogamus']|nr:hypothetical protein H2248_011136 [Termitomyces sp. 'cryptogamus']
MTPGERKILQRIGQALLHDWIITSAPIYFCYGFLMPITLMVAYSSVRHQAQSWLSKYQLVILFLSTSAFSAHLIVKMWSSIIEHQAFQIGIPSLSQRLDYINVQLGKWNFALNCLELIPPIVNDVFIIWRAWIVFQRQRWALCISIALSLCTLVLAIVYMIIVANPDFLMANQKYRTAVTSFVNTGVLISSFVTNIVATSFIVWTLWKHLKFLQTNLDSQQRRLFRLWHILYLLADAGAFYAVLQLLNIVLIFATKPSEFAATIAYGMVDLICLCISVCTISPCESANIHPL